MGMMRKKNVSREKEIEANYIEKKTLKHRVINYLIIIIAAVIYGISVSQFLDPNDLAPGGVTGIAIILNRLIPVETGTLILIINIPILLVGLWKFGIRFLISTIYATFLTSLFTNLFAGFGPLTTEPLLAALAGGCLMAVAMGLVFKAGATTGGTDIIIKLLRLKMPHLRTGVLFMLTDAVIVACAAVVFQDIDKALFAGISAFVTSYVMDLVLYGRDGAKLIYIISDKSDEITARILQELDIGVTHVQGYGAYSGKEKKVIMCVIRKQLAPRAEQIVREEDPLAFMIVTGATEIYGEGYKSYFSEKI